MASAALEIVISGKDQTKGMFKGVTSGLRSLGKVALGVGAAGLAAVGAAAVKATGDFVAFEQGMNEVFTLMPGISGQAMDEMTQQVKDLSTEFGVMPEEVVPALYQSISAGVPRDNVFDFLETAQKAAAGGVTDLTTSVDGISSVVNAYGDDVISAAEASDLMFTAVRLGKTNFEELSANLGDVNPLASALGVNFGDVTAALAAMTSQGTSTNKATTQMRSLLQELSTAGTEVGDVFSETAGVSFTEFIAQGGNMAEAMGVIEQASADTGVPIQDMFGSVEAGMAALQLTGAGAETFSENIDAMGEAAGATDAAFETMDGGLKATGNRLKAMAKVALLDFAGAFEPLLVMAADFAEDALPKIQDVIQNAVIPAVNNVSQAILGFVNNIRNGLGVIQSLINFVSALIIYFGGTVEQAQGVQAALGGIFSAIQSVLGPVADAIGQFVSWKDVLLVLGGAIAVGIALIVGPLVLAIAKISLIIAGVIAVVALLRNAWEQNWGGIQEKTAAVINFIQGIIKRVMTAIRTFWEQNGDQILASARQVWTTIQNVVSTVINTVQDIIQRVTGIIERVWAQRGAAISSNASNVWGSIRDFISSAIETVQSIIVSVVGAISSFWNENLEEIRGAAESVWSAIETIIDTTFENISLILGGFMSAFSGDWEGFGQAIGQAWRNSWDAVKEVLATLWAGFKPLLQNLWNSISSWFTGIDWASLGRAIVDGIIAGLQSAGGALFGAVQGIISGALGAGQEAADEGSPAKAFIPLGENITRGIAAGITAASGATERAMQNTVTTMTTNNITLNVNTNASRENVLNDARLAQAALGGI